MSDETQTAPIGGPPTRDEMIARFGRDLVTDFDLDDPGFNVNFDETIDYLVRKCPVVHSPVGRGYYLINTQDDVRRAAQDWQTFSSAKGYMPNRPEGLPYLMPEESDPPIHTQWRKVLNPHLSPKVSLSYDQPIRDDVNELIDRFIDRGECEFISEFGALLPGWAFFKNVLGLPVDDLAQLVEGVEEGTFNPDLNERARHFGNVFAYLEDHLRWRSEQPERDDLIGTILNGVTYDDGEPAPWEHKVSILVDLTFGGIATTTFVMASAIHHLATNPDQRKLLIDNPALIENAIEEYARFFPPVVALGRTCTRNVEIAGTEIAEGEFVMLTYAAASRDPRHMDDPGKIDLTREGIPHSTFGVGRHRCIGSNLARVELSTTLEEWLKRIPEFSVKPGTEPVYVTGYLRSMRKLELVW
jgi:cytochrome P450